jgi:hypothetical protein
MVFCTKSLFYGLVNTDCLVCTVQCTRLVNALDFHLRYCIKWVCLQLAHFHILHLGLADKLGKVRASTSCALHANFIRAQSTRWEILAFFVYVFIKSAPCIPHNCERLRMPAAYAWRKQETQCKVVFDRLLLESVGKLSRRGGGQQPERLEKSGPC